jgi:S1-C subfamily serine protease
MLAGIVLVFAGGGGGDDGSAGNVTATATPNPGATQPPAQVWLGVSGDTAETGAGIAIIDVAAGSPADDAGLESGDVIVSIDGAPVNDVPTLAAAVTAHESGDELTLSVIKDGVSNPDAAPQSIPVIVEPRPATPSPVPQVSPAPGEPYLGISGGPVASGKGVGVTQVVDGSPADKAALEPGDLILEADGIAVNDIPSLAGIVSSHDVGDEMRLTVIKGGIVDPDGDETDVAVTLEARPGGSASPTAPPGSEQAWLGISGETGVDGGFDVMDVVPDSPADEAGLESGDRLVAIDGERIENIDVLANIIAGHSPGDEVTLTVVKDGMANPDNPETDIEVTLGARPEVAPRLDEGFPFDEIPGCTYDENGFRCEFGGGIEPPTDRGGNVPADET